MERGECRSQKSEVRGQGSGVRSGNCQPLATRHYPLPLPLSPPLSPCSPVRTPTAVVTNLDGFGVEVSKSGGTRSHVFQGKVESPVQAALVSASPKQLRGESLNIDNKGAVQGMPAATDSFLQDLRGRGSAAARHGAGAVSRGPALVACMPSTTNTRPATLNRVAATSQNIKNGLLSEPGKPETRPPGPTATRPADRALRFVGETKQSCPTTTC